MPLISREEVASIQLVLDEADLLAADPACETVVGGTGERCWNPAVWRAVIRRTCGCGKPYTLKCDECRQRALVVAAVHPEHVHFTCAFCHIGWIYVTRWERL